MELIEYIKQQYFVAEDFGVIHENDIKTLAEQFNVKELYIKRKLKAIGCEIYKIKPAEIKDVTPYLDQFSDFKLNMGGRKPKYAQGITIAKTITKALWNSIREEFLTQSNNTCSICGYHTDETKYLHLHEDWEYDEDNFILRLKGISLICNHCHDCQHSDHAVLRKKGEEKETVDRLGMHFMRVNRCSQATYKAYRKWHRSFFDSEMLKLMNLEVEERNKEFARQRFLKEQNWRFFLYNELPYRDEVIKQLKKKDRYID
jgi:hypothetical protein